MSDTQEQMKTVDAVIVGAGFTGHGPLPREAQRRAVAYPLPCRCKEISDEVPEVRVANQADGNEEGPDEVSRVIQMLESQVSARADGNLPATVLRMS
jgi:hypothetical protein